MPDGVYYALCVHPDRPFESNGATVPAGGTAAKKQREGLSLQTLVIAAVASGIAAIVTSHVWRSGTAVAAAMTPVIVALIKEALQRPLESERVRRPVSKVSEIATARRAVAGAAAARTEAAQRHAPAFGSNVPPPPPPGPRAADAGVETAGDQLLSPRRNYVSGAGTVPRRRGLHVKLAIVTGLLAFVIAALVLTVPELLFGSAVTSSHSTTIFGGGSSKSSQSDKKKSDSKTGSDKQNQPKNQGTQTTPSQQQQQPTTTTPQQTTPQQTTPQQPAPSGSAPAPSSPPPSSSPAAPTP